ncbi:hypothetical protein SmJEL517_g03047 [Synchytrium microbalum]|uniref:Importin-95 n=1 Tax=Synchytrium microbalum TaxID=1806994 RepID=A0A507C3K3_9FUNG|nr:uncharacterized protein SmJEL517_g03047 [Synchytrium microbalum]TPX34252.1 hypothetical protein SmJEL517_g03047 [Synchytrium microbalum]
MVSVSLQPPSLTELLNGSLSADTSVREQATKQLETLARENFPMYMGLLATELASEQNMWTTRTSAGLALKNALTAKDEAKLQELTERWVGIEPEIKATIRSATVSTLGSQEIRAAHTAAQAVAAIAAVDLPRREWPELIPSLLNNVTMTDNKILKQATLQAIGFICDEIEPMVLATEANPILTAVVQGARKEETSQDVRLAAIQALSNSLEFVRENFEREGERNIIMQVVCEATQSPDANVQVAAFECLVRIMSLYYDKMGAYMQRALFGLTLLAMKSDNQSIVLQAVEFWSTVCEEELELAAEAQEATEAGEQPTRQSQQFANGAVTELAPILLWLLTKKEEDDDEDEWNESMAAATCLTLLANCVEDTIVQPVISFVQQHIRTTDWKYREAAVMAFGSILEGPTPRLIIPLVTQALPYLIEMMKDEVVAVKDTTAWTLGRICELLVDAIRPDTHLFDLVNAITIGLTDSPRVAKNCCWCIINLAEQLGQEDVPDTYVLSNFFVGIITTLMDVADKSTEMELRASAYEAISTMVSHCAKDCFSAVSKLTTAVLDRLDHTVQMQSQLVGPDDRMAHHELQSNLCSVLTSIIRRLSNDIKPVSDRIMSLLLTIMSSSSKSSTVLEDAFLTVGAMTTAVEGDFVRYMDAFKTYLWAALQNHEEYQMCSIAVGLVGDICRALSDKVYPYCDTTMNLLLADLQSRTLHRDVKPAIFSCFGDIALAIGPQFETYLHIVMMVLQQASQTRIEGNSYDMIDYANQLREGIVEAYVGITQGLKATRIDLLSPSVQHIFGFLQMCAADPERTESLTRSVIGLLGDLASAFPPGLLKPLLSADWIDQLLKSVKADRGASQATKEVAKWAREVIKRQMMAV